RAIRHSADKGIPVPSVVHWKVGHYAAILEEADGRYRVKDPAFGQELWMDREAVASESSGYFLVPESIPDAGWTAVAASEAARVVGAGYTSSLQDNATSDDDLTECDDPCSASGDTRGMPRYRIHSMLVSLNI